MKMYINPICDLLLPGGMNNSFRREVVDYKWCFATPKAPAWDP